MMYIGCGGATGNSLSSPNYPKNYDNFVDCKWKLNAPKGQVNVYIINFIICSHIIQNNQFFIIVVIYENYKFVT